MPDRISDDILHSIPTRMFLFVIPKYFFRFLRSRPRWDRRFSMAEEQMLQAKSEASSLRTQLQAVGPGPPRVVLDGETNGGSPILRSWDSETRWWWDHYEMIMRWLRWSITVWFLFLPRWDDYDDSCCCFSVSYVSEHMSAEFFPSYVATSCQEKPGFVFDWIRMNMYHSSKTSKKLYSPRPSRRRATFSHVDLSQGP